MAWRDYHIALVIAGTLTYAFSVIILGAIEGRTSTLAARASNSVV